MKPRDTDDAAWQAQIEAYRRLGPEGRLLRAFELSEHARDVTRAGIRARHPEYDAARVEQALRRLVLGDELCRAAWPDKPFVEP